MPKDEDEDEDEEVTLDPGAEGDKEEESEEEEEEEEEESGPSEREMRQLRRQRERTRRARHQRDELNPRYQEPRRVIPKFEGMRSSASDFQNIFAQILDAFDTIKYKQDLTLERLAKLEDRIEDVEGEIEYLADCEESREGDEGDEDEDDDDEPGPTGPTGVAPSGGPPGPPGPPREGFWGMIDMIPEPVQKMLAPYIIQLSADFPICLIACKGNAPAAMAMLWKKWQKQAMAEAEAAGAAGGTPPGTGGGPTGGAS